MSRRGPQPGWFPCGTDAAYRRHLANGEPTDAACRAANRRRHYDKDERRQQRGDAWLPDSRPKRNGIPERPYAWRARSYPWARRVLAAAEAAHGAPEEEVA